MAVTAYFTPAIRVVIKNMFKHTASSNATGSAGNLAQVKSENTFFLIALVGERLMSLLASHAFRFRRDRIERKRMYVRKRECVREREEVCESV